MFARGGNRVPLRVPSFQPVYPAGARSNERCRQMRSCTHVCVTFKPQAAFVMITLYSNIIISIIWFTSIKSQSWIEWNVQRLYWIVEITIEIRCSLRLLESQTAFFMAKASTIAGKNRYLMLVIVAVEAIMFDLRRNKPLKYLASEYCSADLRKSQRIKNTLTWNSNCIYYLQNYKLQITLIGGQSRREDDL